MKKEGFSLHRIAILSALVFALEQAPAQNIVVNGDFGTLNLALTQLGLPFNNHPWLASARSAFTIEIMVGILVSIPFTVTILLGGSSGEGPASEGVGGSFGGRGGA